MAGDRLEDCLGDTDNFLKLMPQRINLSIKHLAFDIPDRKYSTWRPIHRILQSVAVLLSLLTGTISTSNSVSVCHFLMQLHCSWILAFFLFVVTNLIGENDTLWLFSSPFLFLPAKMEFLCMFVHSLYFLLCAVLRDFNHTTTLWNLCLLPNINKAWGQFF